MITMIPIPMDFYVNLANLTREITYAGSLWTISLLGITFFREGYLIYLPTNPNTLAL